MDLTGEHGQEITQIALTQAARMLREVANRKQPVELWDVLILVEAVRDGKWATANAALRRLTLFL